jgi:hypothetical protein
MWKGLNSVSACTSAIYEAICKCLQDGISTQALAPGFLAISRTAGYLTLVRHKDHPDMAKRGTQDIAAGPRYR